MPGDKFHSDETVANWFEWHPPVDPRVRDAHEEVRTRFKELGVWLNNVLPEGADKTSALRATRKAMMEANGCLAVAGHVFPDYEGRAKTPGQ